MRVVVAVFILFAAGSASALQGGSYVKQERFPGTIAFYLPKTATQERCTAVQVSKNIFLTAAHCFDRYEKDGSNPTIVFVANEVGEKNEPRYVQFERRLLRAPVIHPDYYTTGGFWGAFRNTQWGSNPDLALIKINEEIEGLSVASVASTNFHEGQTLLIGGFGPALAAKECLPVPCSIRMHATKITSMTAKEILMASNDVFLTGGDSGGPAYEVRAKGPIVVAVNQGCDNLHRDGAGKITRLSKIDFAWYDANIERLEQSRK